MEDIPIMQEQEIILVILVFCCIFMFCLVLVADRRTGECPAQAWSASPRDSGSGSSEESGTSSPNSNGKGKEVVRPSETTPLLSPDSTLFGSGSASLSTKRSDSSASWNSTATDGSRRD